MENFGLFRNGVETAISCEFWHEWFAWHCQSTDRIDQYLYEKAIYWTAEAPDHIYAGFLATI